MLPIRRTTILTTILLLAGVNAAGQNKPVPACKEATLAALRELPKLEYDCPEGLIESDDKLLRLTPRLAAIRGLMKELAGFANVAWWRAGVDELNACKLHGSAGELTDEEKQGWKSRNYSFDLFGNHEIRLVLIADPCYQTGFNGSNAFLLYRTAGRIFVTQVLDGYYSRADNSVGVDFASLNGQQLIEVSTGNSMPPSMVYYYFVIDPLTHRAVPKRLVKVGNKFTNQIYSAMLLADPEDAGLPANASELNVIVNGRLAPSFSAYEEDEHGRIKASGRRFRRIVYRWNGRFYAQSR